MATRLNKHYYYYYYYYYKVAAWLSSNGVAHIKEVTSNLRRARLVLGWVTMPRFNSWCGTFVSVCDQPPRSTQPGHPFMGRCNAYQPKGTDAALRLGSKGISERFKEKELTALYKFICLLFFTWCNKQPNLQGCKLGKGSVQKNLSKIFRRGDIWENVWGVEYLDTNSWLQVSTCSSWFLIFWLTHSQTQIHTWTAFD